MSTKGSSQDSARRWCVTPSQAFGFLCIAYTLGLLIWCAWSVSNGVPEAFEEGDGGVLELYTLHASHGQWALGPYSRFGWYHPGPFYIYALVPFYLASGRHSLGLTAGALAINVVVFAISALVLVRHAAPTMTAAVMGALAVYLLRAPQIVTSTWNPHVLLLAYAALLITGAAVASGRLALLPQVALLATFIAQTHVGLAPVALALAAVALITGLRATSQSRGRWLGITALALLATWLPPLWDQVADTGNIGRLLAFFAETSTTPSRKDTFTVWTGTLLQPFMANFETAWGGAPPPMQRSAWMGTIAISEVGLLMVASVWMVKRDRHVEAWLCRLSAVASLVALAAIARIRGGLVDHLTFWNTMTGTLNAGVLLGVALIGIGDVVRARLGACACVAGAPRWFRAAVPLACAIAVLILASDGAATLRQRRAELIAHPPKDSPLAQLYLATRAGIGRARLHRPLIEVRGRWGEAATIVVQLDKHGIPVGVEHTSAWLYGAPVAERGDEDGAVSVADVANAGILATRPNECLLAAGHETYVFLRTPTAQQSQHLHCAPFEPQPGPR